LALNALLSTTKLFDGVYVVHVWTRSPCLSFDFRIRSLTHGLDFGPE